MARKQNNDNTANYAGENNDEDFVLVAENIGDTTLNEAENDDERKDDRKVCKYHPHIPHDPCILSNTEDDGWKVSCRRKPKFNNKIREVLQLDDDAACVSWEMTNEGKEPETKNDETVSILEYFNEDDRNIESKEDGIEEIAVAIVDCATENVVRNDDESDDDVSPNMVPDSIEDTLSQLKMRELNLSSE